MITKNYNDYIYYIQSYADSSKLNIKDLSNNNVSIYTTNYKHAYVRFYSTALLPSLTDSSGNTYIAFGSNDTEESENDYTINLITGLSIINSTGTGTATSDDGNIVTNTTELLIKNTNSEEKIINEVGIVQGVTYDVTSNNPKCKPVLMFRKKLDTPVTIQANETKQFSMQIVIDRS